MFRHVSKSAWQTLGNISEKHRETSNVSAFVRSKFCFRNVVSTGGQTWKHLRKHRESQMFPQHCFLVCPGLKELWLDWIPLPILKQQCHPLRIRSAHRSTWKSSPNFFKCIEFQYGVCARRHADSCTGVQGKMLVEKRCFRAEKSTEIYGRKSTERSI